MGAHSQSGAASADGDCSEGSGVIVVVSNLLRAGSSLTMQMLHAGGYQCVGRWPDFEVEQTEGTNEWLRRCEGMAVKVLDPHRYRPPPGPDYRVIWIDRDVRQQAKSTIKAQREMAGMNVHRSHLKDMERLIRESRKPALDTWRSVGARMLMMRFERMVLGKHEAAEDIAKFIGADLDTEAMAAAVVKRRPGCLQYMLEFKLLEQARMV